MTASLTTKKWPRVHWYGSPYFSGCYIASPYTPSGQRKIQNVLLTNVPQAVTCTYCKAGLKPRKKARA